MKMKRGTCLTFQTVALVPIVSLTLWFASSLRAEPVLGVNRPGIAWLQSESWKTTVDAIAVSGARAIRMMLVPPFSRSLDVVAYCNERNLPVLLMIPLGLEQFYSADVHPRSGNGQLYDVRPLSRLDMDKFLHHWSTIAGEIHARRLKVMAIQIGNEFNSADFNGDLPLVKGGAILHDRSYREYNFWDAYETGTKKLVEASRIVALTKQESNQLADTVIVLGGLARPNTDWLKHVNASLVEPNVALRTAISLGIDRYVNAYGAHIYPDLHADDLLYPDKKIAAQIDAYMTPLTAVNQQSKYWWITEWGFRQRKGPDGRPLSRLPLFQAFVRALAQSRWASLVQATFIYDWDENRLFRIWDGKTVLGRKDLLPLFSN
jgi:hypothetical protein